MGIITHISTDYDEDAQEQKIYVRTKFGISTRSALNRVAGRAAVTTGVGQRTLVAAAYDEEGIDLVFREGPFKVLDPEEKFEDAQHIEYQSTSMDSASSLGDVLPPRLQDAVEFGEFREGEQLHIWTVPFEVGGKPR